MTVQIGATCDMPSDAGFFDDSSIANVPRIGDELVLASYVLHRNHCGVLLNFAQFTNLLTGGAPDFESPGLEWQLRCNGVPRDPYISLRHIVNPWGCGGMPIALRLDGGCTVELVVRKIGASRRGRSKTALTKVGGRIVGRYWYNGAYG